MSANPHENLDRREMARMDQEIRERMAVPPCMECGAVSQEDAQNKCNCAGDKDDCHGCQLWPD